MKINAVIFDLDGTVLADEDEYCKAFCAVLSKLGVEKQDQCPHVPGIGVEANWELFIKKLKVETDKSVSELARETQKEYLKTLNEVTLKKGFEAFVKSLRRKKVFTTLATSNSWDVVDKIFKEFEIDKYFDCVTTIEEVAFAKPDPGIFIVCAQKMGVDPGECVVIEDSKAGVEAAHAAGMKVVALARDKKQKGALKSADLVVKDFTGLSYEKLKLL